MLGSHPGRALSKGSGVVPKHSLEKEHELHIHMLMRKKFQQHIIILNREKKRKKKIIKRRENSIQ